MEVSSERTLERRRRDDHVVMTEPGSRRVRVLFGGEWIADTRQVLLLHETGHVPVYYFPREDVRMDLLEPTSHRTHCPYKGDASYWTVRAGGRTAENAVWSYPDPIDGQSLLRDYLAFYWDRMDRWFEEDEEVYVHPRDPYKRVDALRSSRHVRIELGGEVIAESTRPTLLFETGLPTRYYLPEQDVRMDLLEESETTSQCPYKGIARYWHVQIGAQTHRDIAWSYPFPIPECPKIEGLVSFFNERVDAAHVDGEREAKPRTRWSAE